MNLIEAIKSGQRFREHSNGIVGEWITKHSLSADMTNYYTGTVSPGTPFEKESNGLLVRPVLLLSIEQLLSDSWEIEPQPITAARFWHACNMETWGYDPKCDARLRGIAKSLGIE